MKKTTRLFQLGSLIALVAAAGCSKPHGSDAATLQGTWSGQEAGAPGSSSLVLTGTNLEFHGSDTNEWYKATFILHEDANPKQLVAVITECPFPQYVGKTANAIYRLENGSFTIAANEPGNPAMPASLDDPNTRKLVLKAK